MPGMSSLVELRTVRDRPTVVGDVRVTPESQALIVRLPFAGLVWHRPTVVVVEQPGRAIQRVPIPDVVRMAQVGVVLGTLLLTVVGLIISSRQQEA